MFSTGGFILIVIKLIIPPPLVFGRGVFRALLFGFFFIGAIIMASMIFNSFWDDLSRGNIDADTDTFYMMLITSAGVAAANKDTWTKRSDVTAYDVAAGGGYSAGGQAVACTVTKVTASDQETYVFATTTWAASTITAYGAVVYKRRGGADTADELVYMHDFGGVKSSSSGNFVVNASTITLQN